MEMYEIEQYEVHTMTYRVQAETPAEAIVKLLDGEAIPSGKPDEFIEVADDRGIPADRCQELAEELRQMGVPVEGVIPSIRSVNVLDS